MIRFFNPRATGDEQMFYNGEWPYIHWAEPFSTGVIRYKTLYFISEKSSVNVNIDVKRNPFTGSLIDWTFALYNPNHIDNELYAIDWNYFCDLHAVATDHLELTGHQIELNGSTAYAYQLIIICRSDVEGEFIETFYIDTLPYKVGAEFYGENESLSINLANQGTEIPAMVAKAIYGTDLYEENIDWVLLNRKFRELLTSHLDVMDNKGSYKSLRNALAWFEYDKLVELREVWKFTTPDGTKYFDCPIQTIVSDGIKTRMFNSAKTTHFALRNLKRRIVGHEQTATTNPKPVIPEEPKPNPLEGVIDEIPTTPYIRWYPVLGDPLYINRGDLYDNRHKSGCDIYVCDVYPHINYYSRSTTKQVSKPIYITAESMKDKQELWNALKTGSPDVTWHYSGPSTSMKFTINDRWFDPLIDHPERYGQDSYMLAVICRISFGSDDPVVPGVYKVWVEWKGIKSNEITYVVEDVETDAEVVDLHPEIVEYVKQHPVQQPTTMSLNMMARTSNQQDQNSTIETIPIYSDTIYDHDPDDNEDVLNKISCIWTEDEMKLKMVLLGNFLETYFMPVHAELIRSTVENIQDFSLYMDFASGSMEHDESESTTGTFSAWWGNNENPADPYAPHTIDLTEVQAFAGVEQGSPYAQAFENNRSGSIKNSDGQDFVPMIACHTFDEAINVATSDSEVWDLMAGQIYTGIGATEDAHFEFPEPIVSGQCSSNQWGGWVDTSFTANSDYANEICVKFMFPKPGKFKFYFTFVGVSGKQYSRVSEIEVQDNLRVDLQFYKLCSVDADVFETINPFIEPSDIKPMFSRARETEYSIKDNGDGTYQADLTTDDIKYIQYIPVRSSEGAPDDAPRMVKVRTMMWKGSGKTPRENCKKSLDLNKYWIEDGDNEDGVWMRICPKAKDAVLWNINDRLTSHPDVIYDNDVFFPEYHRLADIEPGERIKQCYPIVCEPVFILDGRKPKRLKYSLMDSHSWSFYSYSEGAEVLNMSKSISTPFMAKSNRSYMPGGMYRVTFNYRVGDIEHTVTVSPNWILETSKI